MDYARPAYRAYVLMLLVIAYAFNVIDRYILTILREPIRAEFDLSDTQLQDAGKMGVETS